MKDRLRQRLPGLVAREYIPLAATTLAWAAIAAHYGTADTARLFGATVIVPGVRALTALDVGPSLIRRLRAPEPVYRHARRMVMRLQALSFLAATIFLAMAVLLLDVAGHEKSALYATLVGIGLPSRYLSTAGVGRRRNDVYRPSMALSGLALVGLAIAFDAPVYFVALAWGLREWVALATVLLPWPKPTETETAWVEARLSWQEIASVTAARSKRRLSHQLGKRFLSMLLGPFGSIVARTARDFGGDRVLARYIPHSFAGMLLAAGVSLSIGVTLILISREPAAFVAAASILRLGAVAGSMVIWWRWSSAAPDAMEDIDDE